MKNQDLGIAFSHDLSCLFPKELGWWRTPTTERWSGNDIPAASAKSENNWALEYSGDYTTTETPQGVCITTKYGISQLQEPWQLPAMKFAVI